MYDWAVNEKKLERALLTLKTEGKEATEEAIRALYVKYGGLVNEGPSVEDLSAPEVEEDKPKRKKK